MGGAEGREGEGEKPYNSDQQAPWVNSCQLEQVNVFHTEGPAGYQHQEVKQKMTTHWHPYTVYYQVNQYLDSHFT